MKIKLRKSELWGKEFSLLIGGDRAWTKHSRSAKLSESSYPYMGFLFYLMDYLTLEFLFDLSVPFSSVAQSCPTLWPHGLQHARLPYPSPIPRACSNWCPSSWWYHPTISPFVVPFSSCLQSVPASGSFLMSQFFTSGGQSIGVSASA